MLGIENLETKRKEAVERMKLIGLAHDVVRGFKVQERVCASEGPGLLYWATEDEQKVIHEFEQETGNLVYHIIRSKGPDNMDFLTFLYVSNYEEEWEMDRKGLLTRIDLEISGKTIPACETMTYVHNSTIWDYSEYGFVYVIPLNGGLIRVL